MSAARESDFLDGPSTRETHCFVQWKGTCVAADFYCECGAQGWVGGEMPAHVFPRKVAEVPNEACTVSVAPDISWLKNGVA